MVAINVYKHIINKHPFTMDVPLFSYIYMYGPIPFPLFKGYFPAATMTRKIFISRTLPVGKTIQYIYILYTSEDSWLVEVIVTPKKTDRTVKSQYIQY
jgi:hypothetical protein